MAGYVVYRFLSRRKERRPDTLATGLLSEEAAAFAEALGAHVELVEPAEADVILTLRDPASRRVGVGAASGPRRLLVTATDRAGRRLALDRGALPSAQLAVDLEGDIAATARAFAERLRQ